MMNTVRAIVREPSIQLLEDIDPLEGTEVVVTPLLDETDFWRRASDSSLDAVWDNPEDDVYAELLVKRGQETHNIFVKWRSHAARYGEVV